MDASSWAVSETEEGYTAQVPEGYDEAIIRTRLALRGEGFSILTEAHVGGMLGPEAGDERQYLIMGVWNGELSNRRLGHDLQVAVHLPCNVIVQETGSSALVAALDPAEDVAPGDEHAVEIAAAAREALVKMLQRVTKPL